MHSEQEGRGFEGSVQGCLPTVDVNSMADSTGLTGLTQGHDNFCLVNNVGYLKLTHVSCFEFQGLRVFREFRGTKASDCQAECG